MDTPSNLTDFITLFTNIGLRVIPFLGVVSFLVFILGVVKFIKAAGSEKEIGDSKKLIIWGIIGLFILATIWGIISFAKGEFGFGGGVGIPQIHF